MKKTLKLVIISFCSLFILASCERDNMDGPDAAFYGSIKDAKDGSLIEQDIVQGTVLEAYEMAYEKPTAQNWVIKNNGEFRNDMVFANTYDIYLRNGNFYPIEDKGVKINPGNNQRDYTVTPYIRIVNCKIEHKISDKKIVATFSLEGGKGTEVVNHIRLYAFSDMYVGEPIKFDVKGSNFKKDINAVITPATIYTLEIDYATTDNAKFFKTGRNYYFRVGAKAALSGLGTIRHNYAPCVKITL